MAWIESHQDLATNAKTKRAARMLDVPVPQVIGHLQLLWWWALDHAFEGDLSSFDDFDLADAAMWDGDPEKFVAALIGCGPRDKHGFIEADGDRRRLHDWEQFTSHLRARRLASLKANHKRHHVDKGVTAPDCQFCPSDPPTADSEQAPNGLRTEPPRTPPEPGPTGTGTGTDPTPDAREADAPTATVDNADPEGGGSPIQDQPLNPDDAYGQATIGRLPDRVIRKLHTDHPATLERLHQTLADALRAGIPPGHIRTALNQPALDTDDVNSIGAVAIARIRRLIDQRQEVPA